ncbi:MAG: hypothetical protein HOW73_43415 [Polyangiaceae bacterium]|nr:hypothetical protein [Polyangiaceae bacterium]
MLAALKALCIVYAAGFVLTFVHGGITYLRLDEGDEGDDLTDAFAVILFAAFTWPIFVTWAVQDGRR